jgi:hypothetical protein
MSNSTSTLIQQMLPMLIPVIAIQLILLVVALLDLRGRAATRGPKWMWALIILFIQIIGPIAYFVAGRRDE